MHFLRYPNSLWFFQAGAGSEVQKSVSLACGVTASVTETSVAFSGGTTISRIVSADYFVSLSAHPVTSAAIELSAFAYNATVSVQNSLLARLVADGIDGEYAPLIARATITPVFVLSQSGQFDQSASVACTITASIGTASIAAFLTVTPTYGISASTSLTLLISDQYSVSAAYNVTASTAFTLSKTIEAVEKAAALECRATASLTARIVIDRGGGMYWDRKLQAYVPRKVGFPL